MGTMERRMMQGRIVAVRHYLGNPSDSDELVVAKVLESYTRRSAMDDAIPEGGGETAAERLCEAAPHRIEAVRKHHGKNGESDENIVASVLQCYCAHAGVDIPPAGYGVKTRANRPVWNARKR